MQTVKGANLAPPNLAAPRGVGNGQVYPAKLTKFDRQIYVFGATTAKSIGLAVNLSELGWVGIDKMTS